VKTPEKNGGDRGKMLSLPWVLAGIGAIVIAWEAASRLFGSLLVFPGPLPVFQSLIRVVSTERFFASFLSTFLRVLAGIAISVPLGLAAGIASGLDKRVGAFFTPLFALISATPVMSVILIAFLFLGAEKTPVFTAFLMVFPVMAANTLEGVRRTDSGLKELFIIYRIKPLRTIRYLYMPSLAPFILGGLRSSLSLCWKVVVAAEVLVQPLRSLGTGMQQAKAQLATPELFAWTIATVSAAALTQGIFGLFLFCIKRRRKR
jgi:NitT/TauT family transport system permease protein